MSFGADGDAGSSDDSRFCPTLGQSAAVAHEEGTEQYESSRAKGNAPSLTGEGVQSVFGLCGKRKAQGLDGGFDGDPELGTRVPLPVLYATDLEAMQARVEAAGGIVVKPIYAFPGGRRFHFRDPAGSELAVWSES